MSDHSTPSTPSTPSTETAAGPVAAPKASDEPHLFPEHHPHHQRVEERLEKLEGRADLLMLAIIVVFVVIAGVGMILAVSHAHIRW